MAKGHLFVGLGKVHGAKGVVVDLDRTRHGLIVAQLPVSGGRAAHEGALARVLLPVDQVVPGAEGHQVGVVRRGRDGDRARTPYVRVAQLIRQ